MGQRDELVGVDTPCGRIVALRSLAPGRAAGGVDVTLRAGLLFLAVATLGCASPPSYFRLPQDERRLFEIYSVFMTSAQQARYLGQPTSDARKAYAESFGLPQRLAGLTESEREAALNGQLLRGMSAEGALMAWGYPLYRSRIGGEAEKWEYFPYYSRHLPPSVGVVVSLQEGRVREWVQFVIPAPEGKP